MSERNNVTVAKDLDAVKTIMNALASEITQDAVNALLPRANDVFFMPNEKKTLYYSAGIRDKIRSTFPKEMNEIPQGFSSLTTRV